MKNKKVKIRMFDGYCDCHSRFVDSLRMKSALWAFDRIRLFESGMDRSKLRNPHISKISLTEDQLRGK